jgi:L-lysine 2,3-aminomutase
MKMHSVKVEHAFSLPCRSCPRSRIAGILPAHLNLYRRVKKIQFIIAASEGETVRIVSGGDAICT